MNPPAPASQGPPGCEAHGSKQHVLQTFQTFSMSSYNLCHPSRILSFQLADIRFYSLQQSVQCWLLWPPRINLLPSPDRVPSTWGASYDILKYIEFAMRVQQPPKRAPKCHGVPLEVKKGAKIGSKITPKQSHIMITANM